MASFIGKRCGKGKVIKASNVEGNIESIETVLPSSIYTYDQEVIQNRKTTVPIHPMIHGRRTRQSMNGQPVDKEVLMSLFEAARWAPSHMNSQTCRLIYVTRENSMWGEYIDCLWGSNREWAKEAGALVVIVSKKTFKIKGVTMEAPTHSFDAGLAWMSMALEGTSRGLVMHSISGFNKDDIAKVIKLTDTDEYKVEAIIAVGYKREDENVESDLENKITQRFDIQQILSKGVVDKHSWM